jgi:radical SAM superfamily enzyme YgiQ (UPF0313 family)
LITTNIPEYVQDSTGCLPPLGLLYIATNILKNSNHTVDIHDALLSDGDDTEIVQMSLKYDVIGITSMTFFLLDVINMVNQIREVNKEVPIIIGGPHVAIFPEETLKIEGVTFSMQGECDESFLKLVNVIDQKGDLQSVPGLYWEENGIIKSNPVSNLIDDLDQIPVPNRELLNYQKYHSILSHGNTKKNLTTTAFSSRGCPFKCIFCDRPNLGKQFRSHSPKYVVNEMEKCVNLGITEIFFYDDTFSVDKERVIEICEMILEKRLSVRWDIRARVNNLDLEMMTLMKRAGCSRIHFGVEAGSREMMKKLKKGITQKLCIKAFKAAREAKIDTLGYFMFGCPEESRSQMDETLNFALMLNPDYAHFSILTPFPGTPVYADALNTGLFESDYWREYSAAPNENFSPRFLPNTLPENDLKDILKRSYRKFYLRPGYLLKQVARVKSYKDLTQKLSITKNIFVG